MQKKGALSGDILRYQAKPLSISEPPVTGTRWTLTVRFEKEVIARSAFNWIQTDAPRMIDFEFVDHSDDEPAELGNLLQGKPRLDKGRRMNGTSSLRSYSPNTLIPESTSTVILSFHTMRISSHW